VLRAQYLSFEGALRVGKLLEDIDAFAGAIAYQHCCGEGAAPEDGRLPTLVTASTDRVDLLSYPLIAEQDVVMRGCVSHVGASSMQVDIDTVGAHGAVLLQASLTMVARQPGGPGAVAVPRLVPATSAETALCEAGARASEARREARRVGMDRVPPTPAELQLVHAMHQERMRMGAHMHASHMVPTAPLVSTELTMPQDRNVNGQVFGGWLMRRAYELAWAAGWRATGAPPKFLALDDVAFTHAVEVGSMVTFAARLPYSRAAPYRTYGVSVDCSMSRRAGNPGETPSLLPPVVTTSFHFTFHAGDRVFPPRVLPASYEDAIAWVGSHRKHEAGRAMAILRRSGGSRARFGDHGVI